MITVINASAAKKIFSGLCSSSVTAALALMTVIMKPVVYVDHAFSGS